MPDSVQHTEDVEADLIRLASPYPQTLEHLGPLARVWLTEFAHVPELHSAVASAQSFHQAVADLFRCYQQEGALGREQEWWAVARFFGPLAKLFLTFDPAPVDLEASFDVGTYV